MQKAKAKHFSPRRARRTRRENKNMFCLCFVIFVPFVVRKLAIVFNLGFPDNHALFLRGLIVYYLYANLCSKVSKNRWAVNHFFNLTLIAAKCMVADRPYCQYLGHS